MTQTYENYYKAYYEKNKEKLKEQNKEYRKQYYAKNRLAIIEKQKLRRLNNKSIYR